MDLGQVITDMPTPRGDLMCAALNGAFVAAGGYGPHLGLGFRV